MISVFKWAWQAKPDTPAEKLVLSVLPTARSRRLGRTSPSWACARERTACDMTPAELDAILDRLEKQGFITPLAADSEPVKWHIGALERERGEEGPWKAWRLNAKTEEKETVR